MLEYLRSFYIDMNRGPGYGMTNVILFSGAVLVLSRQAKHSKDYGLMALWCLLGSIAGILLTAAYYAIFGQWQMDRISLAVFIVLYALIFRRNALEHTLLRGFVYFDCTMMMIPVSEPLGEMLQEIKDEWFQWSQYLTPLLVLIMTAFLVWFLREYAFERVGETDYSPMRVQLLVDLLALPMIYATEQMNPERYYKMLVCATLWVLLLATYYLCWKLNRGNAEKERLVAMQHKNELEMERFNTTRINYEEMRKVRHEIKNHDFYIRALVDDGKYDELRAFVDAETEKHSAALLGGFDCGNYAVNVVIGHEKEAARSKGVELETNILVPKTLPMEDVEICSLMSNLLDNAIEAATASGKENPIVKCEMIPKNDYLFIRVENPVSDEYSEKRRLSLKTTKKDNSELHGYGTKVIKKIAEDHQGSVHYSMDEGNFVTDVMLLLPGEEKA